MPRLTIRKLMIAIAITGFFIASIKPIANGVSFHYNYYFHNRIDQIEELWDPQVVVRWDADGLVLENGGRLKLPGITSIPADSMVMKVGTARGVEVTFEGRIIGLVPISHYSGPTCGGAPRYNHLARVDLSDWMKYVEEYDPKASSAPAIQGAAIMNACIHISVYEQMISIFGQK